ncbi:MAG: hypothetical protein LBE35_09840 [Clostridiales bacterium]|nr:hypothetical protein [Clostridiales bacterium]
MYVESEVYEVFEVFEVFEDLEGLEGLILNPRFLNIPTYEGSGQTVHPHVLFFEESFLGYYYIMAITPYPYGDESHENPSIFVSQDGVYWTAPPGVANPVTGAPHDVNYGGYFSDPFLLRRGDTLELWFRHTLAQYVGGRWVRDNNNHNRIYRIVTTDLENWSEFEIVLECRDGSRPFMSPVVMHDGYVYRLWYTNFYSGLFYIESYDALNWSEPVSVDFDLGGIGVWHHDIVFTGDRYEALLTAADWGGQRIFRLFYAVSYDGLSFDVGQEIMTDLISSYLVGMTPHKSTFVRQGGLYQFYIGIRNDDRVWRLFYFEILERNLPRLFQLHVEAEHFE